MTMNRAQIVDLLTTAACYDNRKPNPDTLLAWSEAAHRARWTPQEALDAIHDHYANSTEFLMPAHITEAIRAKRQQPPPMEPRRQIAGPPPADPQRIGNVIAAVAEKLGWNFNPNRREARLYRACPRCGAQPGEPCTRPSKWSPVGRTPTTIHPAREEDL